MKKNIYFPVFLILFCANVLFAQNNTDFTSGFNQNKFFVTAEGKFFVPIGLLTERFKSALGGTFGFGGYVSEEWSWSGHLEYFSFKDDVSKFKLSKVVTLNNVDKIFTVPLPKLTTDLKVTGLFANANYKFLDFKFLRTNLEFGFGVYYWTSNRSEYFDTLKADNNGNIVNVAIVKVPHRWQEDWSGGFNFGVNCEVRTIEKVWLKFGVNYKAIVGELWPALEIGLENIATFQTIELKAGIKVEF